MTKTSTNNADLDNQNTVEQESKDLTCGVVMPISTIDGCSESHWKEVKDIIYDASKMAGFVPNLVSDADDVGSIHKRIIQNLYDSDIVVCDVSGRNPNVMFELGIRLAFDKPTILIKDDKTSYSFDTSTIEHLEYPRDLRYNTIKGFKKNLSDKIKATYEASKGEGYTTFLKHFGKFEVSKLDEEEVSANAFIMKKLEGMESKINKMSQDFEENSFSQISSVSGKSSQVKKSFEFILKSENMMNTLNELDDAIKSYNTQFNSNIVVTKTSLLTETKSFIKVYLGPEDRAHDIADWLILELGLESLDSPNW